LQKFEKFEVTHIDQSYQCSGRNRKCDV